jgi:uncharacterized protein YecT (DUF1311 family)
MKPMTAIQFSIVFSLALMVMAYYLMQEYEHTKQSTPLNETGAKLVVKHASNNTEGAVETLICQPRSQKLQQLDRDLNQSYSALRDQLPEGYRQLLLHSQRYWLAGREMSCTWPSGLSKSCLHELYSERINELKNGLIAYTIAVDELPFKVTDGQGETVRISMTKKKVQSKVESEYELQQLYVQTGDHIDGVLHSGALNERKHINTIVESVRLLFNYPRGRVFVLWPNHDEGLVNHPVDNSTLYYINDHLFNVTAGDYSNALEVSPGGINPYEPVETFKRTAWHREKGTEQLLLIESTSRGNALSGIRSTQKTVYNFDFNQSKIIEMKGEYIEQDLETLSATSGDHYIHDMNEIFHSLKKTPSDADGRMALEMALKDLQSILISVDSRNISWAQLIYAAQKLTPRIGELIVPDRLIYLAKVLLRYQAAIESVPGWEKRLKRASTAGSNSGCRDDDESCERLGFSNSYFVQEGFPVVHTDAWVDGYLYGFWLRRYSSGQYKLVSHLLKLGLKAYDEPVDFSAVSALPEWKYGDSGGFVTWEADAHSLPTLQQGLIAWYPFDGNARDASGNQHHGQLHGASLAADRFGTANSAYSFDGNNDFISIANNDDFSRLNALSVAAWINIRGATFYPSVVSKGNVGNYRESFSLFLDPHNKLGFLTNSNGSSDGRGLLILSSSAQTGKWVHIVGTYDGSMLRTYINGLQVEAIAHQGTLFDTDGSLLIGKSDRNTSTLPTSFFNGLIDDVMIYNRAITADEVNTMYRQPQALSSSYLSDTVGMVAWYPFDKDALDASGHGNDSSQYAAMTADGKEGRALSLNGVDDGINILKTESLNMKASDFSIEVWVRSNQNSSGYLFLNYAGVPMYGLTLIDGGMAQFTFRASEPRLIGRANDPSVAVTATGHTSISDDQWHHLVAVRNGSTASIYVDGYLDGMATDNAVWYANRGSVDTGACDYARIGAVHTASGHCHSKISNPQEKLRFHGIIDELKVYKRALSACEIMHHAGGSTCITGL